MCIFGASGDLTRFDNESRAGLREIVDEHHLVPLTGLVTLGSRFIIPGTILVTDETGGLEFVYGFDYHVNAEQENLPA